MENGECVANTNVTPFFMAKSFKNNLNSSCPCVCKWVAGSSMRIISPGFKFLSASTLKKKLKNH